MTASFPDSPSRVVSSSDGTPIAVFSAGSGPALLLVHGTSSDHRTWRSVVPELARSHALSAIDRRGRGDSGDAPEHGIEREIEDVVAVAEALAVDGGSTVDLLGHSLGGRIALGAATRTTALRRIAVIESAPEPGVVGRHPLLARLRELLAAGDDAGVLAEFMSVVVGMSAEDLDRFRADPVWPLRVATAPTIVRELAAAGDDPAIGFEALAGVRLPVLQIVGSASPAWFRDAAEALDRRLANGQIVVVDGARHAPHSTHPHELAAVVEAFLAAPSG